MAETLDELRAQEERAREAIYDAEARWEDASSDTIWTQRTDEQRMADENAAEREFGRALTAYRDSIERRVRAEVAAEVKS